ncbi:MAG TPA: hypothetical protein VN441_13340 [Syntrophomonas sp.]|nr:hypothetical protein [Syntrophomonas sp.]
MNFELLQSAIPVFDELRVLNKSFTSEDATIQLVGLIRQGKSLKLYALQLDEQVYEAELLEEEQEFSRPPRRRPVTNRQQICDVGKIEYRIPLTYVNSIFVEGQEFQVSCTVASRLGDDDLNCILLLAEFMKNGFKPCDSIETRDFSHILFSTIELEGEYDHIPPGKQSGDIVLCFGNNDIRQYPVQKRLQLHIGRNYPRAFQFKDKRMEEIHRFYIQRVYLMDIWAETEKSLSDPRHLESISEADLLEMKRACFEHLERLCPRGMYLPVIEYEAEEAISFEFHTVEYLNARYEASRENRASSILIMARPEEPMGRHGMKLKAAVIQRPVSGETESLYVELFRYSRIVKHEDMVL